MNDLWDPAHFTTDDNGKQYISKSKLFQLAQESQRIAVANEPNPDQHKYMQTEDCLTHVLVSVSGMLQVMGVTILED